MLAYTSPTTDQVKLTQSVDTFARQTPGIVQAIVVSDDGLLLAMSENLGRDDCDRFAAVTSAMTSLAIGAARTFDLGEMSKLVVDLDRAFLLLSAFGPAAWLGVIARRDADLGDLARKVAAFVEATASAGAANPLDGRPASLVP